MFFLLGEINFWTFDNDVNIKDTDFGAFSYHDKKTESSYEDAKKSYAQRRGMIYTPQNKKGNKLKDSIKYLMEQLKEHSNIFCQWFDYCTMQIMLSSGLLIYIQINLCSGDIKKIVFDKYLVGKLSERLSDVIVTKNYLISTNNDSQINLINFSRPKKNIFEKISRLDPKITVFELCGTSGRRLEKMIQHNRSEDMILIWWKSTSNEVYPWSPNIQEHNRANVHLYKIISSKLELICYLRTEFDPLCIMFSTNYDNLIHSLEQKVSQKGEVTVEWRSYEVSQNDKLQRITVDSVSLPTHTSSVKFSPTQEKLLICCIDGSLTLYDQIKGTNYNIKLAFIPTLISWHRDGNIFSVGNERGQVQHFDIALNCIKNQVINEDVLPNTVIDLSSFFRTQSALTRLEWSVKSDLNSFVDHYNHGDSLFLMIFERGPVAIMKVIEGNNFPGDILIQKYLEYSQIEQAASLLFAMNWDSNPNVCMNSLNQIVNFIFKLPLTPERENIIQNALGSFHVPIKPLSQSVIDEYGDEIRDLTRRFFHHLLRYRLFEKAFRLAIDLNDHDLFMDIHFYAIVLKDTEMATAAKEKAEEIISRCNSCNSSHSTCSRSSCSICSYSVSDKDESYSDSTESEESFKKQKIHVKSSSKRKYSKSSKSKVPPLPVVYDPLLRNDRIKSLPYTHVTDKTETNLMSTSFNLPNSNISSHSYNAIQNINPNSIPTHVPSTWSASFNPPLTDPNFVQTTKNSDSLMASVKNISLKDQLNITESSINSLSLENKNNSYKVVDHATSAFSGASFNPGSMEVVPNSTMSSRNNSSNHFMSTSFTNQSSGMNFTSKNHPFVSTELKKNDDKINGLKTSVVGKNIESVNNFLKNAAEHSDNVVITVEPAKSKCNDFPLHPILDCANDLMSTSFNDPEDFSDNTQNYCDSANTEPQILKQKHSKINISASSLINNQSNFIQNLPLKNYVPPESPGFSAESSVPKIQQHQIDKVSNILRNHQHNSNFQSACKYRLDYDFDYLPLHNTSENSSISNQIFVKSSSNHNTSSKLYNKPPKVELTQSMKSINPIREKKLLSNVPPLPIISNNPVSNEKLSQSTAPPDTAANVTEKPKVKFSDTVTHILVPNNAPSYRPIQKRAQIHSMDPKRELAESLPLYIGNEDYLKDFQPLSKGSDESSKEQLKTEEPTKIKVVHFGLL